MTETGDGDVSQQLDQLNRLGFQLFEQKLYPQVLETLGQVVDLARRARGEQHEDLGLALLNRGRVYRLLKRDAECEADYLRALDIYQRSAGDQRERVIWLLKNLSALYSNTDRQEQSEPYSRQLLALQRASLPPGDVELAQTMVNLALACTERGASGESVALLSEALQIRSDTLGPTDPRTVQLRGILEMVQASANQAITPGEHADSIESASSPQEWAETLRDRAHALFQQGDAQGARSLYEQVCEAQRSVHGEHHLDYAAALFDLGAACYVLGDRASAEAHYRRALAIQETELGQDHAQARSTRKELAGVLAALGQLHEAGALYRRVLAEDKAAGLHRNAEWADMAVIQARFSLAIGEPEPAEGLFRDALDVSREVHGPQADTTREIGRYLLELLIGQQRLDEARKLGPELVETRISDTDGQTPSLADMLDRRARYAFDRADMKSAESLWKEALAALSEAPQGDAPMTARILNNLGALARTTGDLAQAASYFDQALDAAKKIVPEDATLTLGALGNQALILHDLGRLRESEAQYRQVLDRLLTSPGPVANHIAGVRNNLGMVLKSDGRFTEAEQLLVQARESNRTHRGEEDPETVKGTANLGLLYYEMGLFDRAEPLLREAVTLRQRILPPAHPDLAQSLQNLGELCRVTGRLELADHLMNQALAVWRAGVGEGHPDWATAVNNLALLCMARQDWVRAEELSLQVVAYRRAALGDQHPDLATSLDTLAGLYRATGRCAEAEPLCRSALQIRRAVLGEVHPDVAWSLNNLALIAAATGRFDEADDLLRNSSFIDDRLIAQVFSVGSEGQRLRFLSHLRERYDVVLSLLLQHRADRPDAVRFALDLVLRRKGLAAEVLAAQHDAIRGRHDPALTQMLEELTQLRHDIAAMTLGGPAPLVGVAAHREALVVLQSQRESFETKLAQSVPQLDWAQRLSQIDAVAVARALPSGSALVEYVRIEVRDFSAVFARGQPEWQGARYLALVLPANEPDSVALLDLGEAEPVEDAIARVRVALSGDLSYSRAQTETPATDAGEDVRRLVFDPLLPRLAGRTRVIVSTDGDLATLPFEALPLDRGTRLIDRYVFSYLSCGRDLLRMQGQAPGIFGAAFVAADPDFDLSGDVGDAPLADGRESRDLSRNEGAVRLPGTRAEAETVAGLLGVQALLGKEVLKRRFRDVHSPQIMHVATHGFFLKDQTGFRQTPGFPPPLIENPLLRSGLLLAGFNTWLRHGSTSAAAENGMLNGEDVAGLDLAGTELVVLSACETGLGQVNVGEGVFGLRRAFVVAGARTLVMSLWKVPDAQTQELMVDFYKRVLAGEPRAEALRMAQLALKARWPDPTDWAAFICQGDPGPLQLPTDQSKSRV